MSDKTLEQAVADKKAEMNSPQGKEARIRKVMEDAARPKPPPEFAEQRQDAIKERPDLANDEVFVEKIGKLHQYLEEKGIKLEQRAQLPPKQVVRYMNAMENEERANQLNEVFESAGDRAIATGRNNPDALLAEAAQLNPKLFGLK